MAEKLTPGPSYIQSEVWIGQVCGGWGGVHWVSGVLNKSYRFWGCVCTKINGITTSAIIQTYVTSRDKSVHAFYLAVNV